MPSRTSSRNNGKHRRKLSPGPPAIAKVRLLLYTRKCGLQAPATFVSSLASVPIGAGLLTHGWNGQLQMAHMCSTRLLIGWHAKEILGKTHTFPFMPMPEIGNIAQLRRCFSRKVKSSSTTPTCKSDCQCVVRTILEQKDRTSTGCFSSNRAIKRPDSIAEFIEVCGYLRNLIDFGG